MTDVLLVTCAELPEGEPRGDLLVKELADRGLTAAWVVWDDPAVDWAAARVAVVRSPWDYERRRRVAPRRRTVGCPAARRVGPHRGGDVGVRAR